MDNSFFKSSKDLLMKVFVYEIDSLKNLEYDENNLIKEFKAYNPEFKHEEIERIQIP